MSDPKQNYKTRHVLTLDMYYFSDDPETDAQLLADAIERMHEVYQVEVQQIDLMPFGAKKSANVYMKTAKWKVGDKVKILNRSYGHEFKIGEIVTILEKDDEVEDWLCQADNGKKWWVRETEAELITNKQK
jgi:hypothetical protein